MPWLLKMTLFAATIKAVVDLYLGWRLIRAVDYLNPAPGSYMGWVVVLCFLGFYLFPLHGLTRYLLGGNVGILTYSKPLIYLFWFGFAFSFQVLIWIVGADILKILANANGINAPQLDQLYAYLVIGFSVILLLYTGYKMYSDTLRIETETITHSVEGLPGDLGNFKIAHITDIQADRYTGQNQVSKYVDKVNEQNPDIVVITGDLISYGTDYVEMAAEEMGRIEAPYGTYFVVGDHDYWAGAENITGALREHGIKILEAENANIQVGSAKLRLSGLTNVYSREAPVHEIRNVMKDSTIADLRVMATHQVSRSIIEESKEKKYEILLAGHTHGGQIRVPLFFTQFSAPDFETRYVHGQYYDGDMLINVNNGLGFTLSPVRYNAPPNISVITLEGK
ncbi:metallophosphoesterase [Aliifodinibius sp. S!AR15-10]|uniref:metallophosphoesterase n=1 Tax=Aliifodinibius sp. S!AR15-10 TaxID=2950437 RepID=UPI00285C510C|nr:metallophosphoesterase [Aliifodinibius sp. S!AR15-10]MDR8392753.1 metallophosphoesterase [Aliifodinibius sp. S!AR15-10]